jgi:hypothetical protein
MFRASASPRLLAGFVLAAVVGSGIGLVAAGIGPFSATTTPPALHGLTAAASTAAAPATTAAPTSSPLTADQAKAIALQVSSGTVVEVQQENGTAEANDPTEATGAPEPTDPAEATDTAEPTGLSYDVTVLHQDGSTTEVVVDAVTDRVVSTKTDRSDNQN